MTSPQVAREPSFVADGPHPFFAWYHEAPEADGRDCVAVLCGPTGYEYTRVHRTVRHLADRLARAGIPSVRLDYHGIGDSPGTDLDPDRVAVWQANVERAIGYARERSGRARVCVIGVRLGATLGMLATGRRPADLLVLWNPCLNGRAYLRELQAIAMTAAQTASASDAGLEAAGFVMTPETMATLRALDLRKSVPRASRVLMAYRDDATPDPSYARHLQAAGVACDEVSLAGWPGMVAEHQFTVVPDAALERIVAWVREHSGEGTPQARRGETTSALEVAVSDETGRTLAVTETLCRFGEGEALFGVLTRASADPQRPAILLFNAGSAHHVGPNRVYVTLARSLAALGFACLRFDLEGIGDSILRGPGRENHPYPRHATRDARAAVEFLKARYGYRDFVALGLCSGAHTAFHAGLSLAEHEIRELVMINPLTFYWQEGATLDQAAYLYDAQAYRKSMRDPARWMKLLRGDVNFRRLFEVALSQPKNLAKSCYDGLCESLLPRRAPRLSQDLRRLIDMKRRMTLLVAEGDPGRDLLMSGARLTAARAIKAGHLTLETIPGADHTFSQSRQRKLLLERLAARLTQPQS